MNHFPSGWKNSDGMDGNKVEIKVGREPALELFHINRPGFILPHSRILDWPDHGNY